MKIQKLLVPQSFAHKGNLLRHMALHDPENKELLVQADEADEEAQDGYEVEDIGLETPGQIIQTVRNIQNQISAALRRLFRHEILTLLRDFHQLWKETRNMF